MGGGEEVGDVDPWILGHAGEDSCAVTVAVVLDALLVKGEGALSDCDLVLEAVEGIVTSVMDHGAEEDSEDGEGGEELGGASGTKKVVRCVEHVGGVG